MFRSPIRTSIAIGSGSLSQPKRRSSASAASVVERERPTGHALSFRTRRSVGETLPSAGSRLTPVDADPAELRVLGCLIEKQRTTPDTYPLSLNALRLACNQSTNRDPVVEYDEQTIRHALDGLTVAAGRGSRAAGQPGGQVPAPVRRGAAARRRGDLAARGADAPRAADARRAEAAHRSAAPVREPGRDRGVLVRSRSGSSSRGCRAGRGRRRSRYEHLLGGRSVSGARPPYDDGSPTTTGSGARAGGGRAPRPGGGVAGAACVAAP